MSSLENHHKEAIVKIGIAIGVVIACLLAGYAYIQEEPPSGSVKDNFGNNWAR